MAHLRNKIIWITGASSGIGEALAYLLVNRQCRVILSARNQTELKRVASLCSKPENTFVLPLDLSNTATFETKTRQAIGAFGAIDILINNAGISQRSLIIDTEIGVYKKLIEINYLGTIALTKAVLPHFKKQSSGHFVTTSSLMGKFASPLRSGYCASKHALHGFFDVLRMEHENDNIAVSLICPGFVQTNIAKKALTKDGSPQNTDDNATKNGITAEQCALHIIRAIEKKKFEVNIGGKEVLGTYLKRFFPKLLHRFVKNRQVT